MTKITRQRSHANEEQAAQMKVAAQSLIDALGGLTHASTVLDVKYYVLNGWRTRGRIPAYQAERIASIPALNKAGFTFEFMRPDLTKRIEI